MEGAVHDIKLSTVVPASITGEDESHHLSDLDLAMKLHYITTVHFFGGDAAAGLGIQDFKKPMFKWLQLYYPICGRLRRGGGGRPYVKCNDSGVRIVEATCTKTVEEWLQDTVDGGDHHRLLVYHHPILAHDFGFTPFVFLQLTKFKCGGVCVGMRWAHILGDAFAASECINMWGNIMANHKLPPHYLTPTPTPTLINHHPLDNDISCRSIKLLEPPLGDNWLTPNNSKLHTHTFHLTQTNLPLSLEEKEKQKIQPFDLISAIIWKSMAKLRGTMMVNICKTRTRGVDLENVVVGNVHQVIGVVEAQTIMDADIVEVSKMVANNFVDETRAIAKRMAQGDGNLDFVVYGSSLTFVNWEHVNLYGLQLNKGQTPVFANVSIGGVGDEGAVVVTRDSGGDGRLVNVILPQHQLQHLKNELRMEWGIL